jgi:hypothetical protein
MEKKFLILIILTVLISVGSFVYFLLPKGTSAILKEFME